MNAEVIKSNQAYRCCICGKPTRNIEICYEAPFCSDDCIRVMDSMYKRHVENMLKNTEEANEQKNN